MTQLSKAIGRPLLALGLALQLGAMQLAHAKEALPPPQQFAQLGAFKLENQTVIDDCALGYRTLGTLNAERSNAIVFLTWHNGKSSDILGLLGPKGLFDPAPYYVVVIDALGNGVSCSPSNSKTQHGPAFPAFSIRDMVASQHRLLTETLKLNHVRAVMGFSMGGMQTFQWMVSHPEFMDLAFPLSGTPRMSSYDQLFWRTEELLMVSDPDYAQGHYKKNPPLAAMQLVFSMNFNTPAYRVANTGPKPEEFEKFWQETIAYDPDNADANDWRWQARAMLTQDIGVPVTQADGQTRRSLEAAAAKVKARSHVVVARQDHLVNPKPALDFAPLIKAGSTVLESDCGHLAVQCEIDRLRPIIERLLDQAAGSLNTPR
ncbi:alpha/beta fold hydrolase [Roseateles oligotrophus]|uniref:Alpha/beta fold hydrolase n=1 Tax=Roseateles oligotrophus TaxID=1769250 RepID=A0ABT2YL21_9BURK|nr:alpha/beta fold hydrolase [Roseateles oligotrophus]MCV2370762.1 alpha/beta fold hydrolase [Roseateles oligotrophus]